MDAELFTYTAPQVRSALTNHIPNVPLDQVVVANFIINHNNGECACLREDLNISKGFQMIQDCRNFVCYSCDSSPGNSLECHIRRFLESK